MKNCSLLVYINVYICIDFKVSGRYGKHPNCKRCRHSHRNSLNFVRTIEGMKICPQCHIEKSVSEYNADRMNTDGLQTHCKLCKKEMQKKSQSTFDGFIKQLYHDLKTNSLKKSKDLKVNITIDDIVALYRKQEGKCAISGKVMTYTKYNENKYGHIKNKNNISVDRIDSNKHYDLDNIQLVCGIINRMKYYLPNNVFLQICTSVYKHNYDKIDLITFNKFIKIDI